MKQKILQNTLLLLVGLLGLGAIFGGVILIISPSGELFGMPLAMLDNSPFKTFLVPGIILFSVLGSFPIVITLALLKRPENKFLSYLMFIKICIGLGRIPFILHLHSSFGYRLK